MQFLYREFNLCAPYYSLIKHRLLPQKKLTNPFCKSDDDYVLRYVGIQYINVVCSLGYVKIRNVKHHTVYNTILLHVQTE